MAFIFRRGRKSPFKHIAHGLVPAATIAPKPAVPRTPPPRSPNPSPERPRSALAAAVFAAALTGRTVAIPQPRQRSLSEGDSSYVEQECFEPYAVVSELRTGTDWKPDGSERSSLQPPEISGSDGEDEDMDTYLADADKQTESSCQSDEKRGESRSTNSVYAVPWKNKKEEFPPSSSTNAEEKELHSRETEFQMLVRESDKQLEEDRHIGLNLKEEKPLAENLTREKPPPSPDLSVRARRARENLTREKFRELKQENWCLNKAYQAMAQQLEGTKQQIKEQQLRMRRLEEENRRLREDAEKSHREEEATELLCLRQQAQELVDENDSLKVTVHRLNVELSRYQTKFRPLSQEEHLKLKSLPMRGPPPPWLLDMKYLSPLLLAYEDRIREKEDINLEHEEEMKDFRARVEELVKENEDLHEQLKKVNCITPTEWQQLQTQAKLILEENGLLREQLEMQQAKAKDSHRQRVQEASKLTKQIVILEEKKQSQEEEISGYQKQLEALCSTCEELKAKLESRIAAEEHFALVNDLKSRLQQEQEKKHHEVEDLMGKMSSLQAQNKKLLLEKNSFMAEKMILEAEMEATQKTNRRLKKKTGLLKLQLEKSMEKEIAAHHYLTNLIGLVEKIGQERDHLILLARCLEKENHGVLNKIVEGSLRLGRLEEKVKILQELEGKLWKGLHSLQHLPENAIFLFLQNTLRLLAEIHVKVYKKKASGKIGEINLKMTEQEQEFAEKAARYQQELKHLQHLLQDKQESLDEVLQQKRKVEGELEIIWESTSNENRRMRELLHKSLGKSHRRSAGTGHEPCLNEVSQKDLIYRQDFSYCDVKPPSPTKMEIPQESL